MSFRCDVIVKLPLFSANKGTGHIVTYNDVAVFSGGGNDAAFQDKTTYATLIRISDSYKYVGLAMADVSD